MHLTIKAFALAFAAFGCTFTLHLWCTNAKFG